MPDVLFQWGTGFILWVQSFRSPFFDQLFTFLTLLGEEPFYLVFLPLVYWCFSRDVGLRLGIVFLLNDYLNGILKDVIAAPRPDDARVAVLREETSPGFPSGHAQNAVVLWGFLASQFRRPSVWTLAVVLPLAIGFSRIYLGVHYPHDVLGGWLIGIAVLVLFLSGMSVAANLGLRPVAISIAAVLVPLVLLALSHDAGSVRDMALLMGLGLGAVGESRLVRFNAVGGTAQLLGRLGVGLVILAALWLGLRVLLPEEPLFRFIRYAVLGLWVALGAPWLFMRLGLARRGTSPRLNRVPIFLEERR
ncbi:MAG: phosphatase PAP2 family protein [Bacillota bacterium]|uniref:phosphatase PAP2 family protein n=1 Tax=Desulforudis sp. DRI-14 TaxID=3459793 RepID=UPI00346FBF04